MIEYCAICTSTWISGNAPDETCVTKNFEEALSFCTSREQRLKEAYIVKCENDKEEIVVSFRTIK